MLNRRGAAQGCSESAACSDGAAPSRHPQAPRGSPWRSLLCGALAVLASCAGAGIITSGRTLSPANVAGDRPALSPGTRDGSRGGAGQHSLGLSEGNYSLLDGGTCESCAARIRHQCGYPFFGHAVPPELLVPGRLGSRQTLSETALCFLWYAKSFWMRGTGGATGLMHYRYRGYVCLPACLPALYMFIQCCGAWTTRRRLRAICIFLYF